MEGLNLDVFVTDIEAEADTMTSCSELKAKHVFSCERSVRHIRVAVKLQPGSEMIGTRGPDGDALMVLSYGQPSVG